MNKFCRVIFMIIFSTVYTSFQFSHAQTSNTACSSDNAIIVAYTNGIRANSDKAFEDLTNIIIFYGETTPTNKPIYYDLLYNKTMGSLTDKDLLETFALLKDNSEDWRCLSSRYEFFWKK